MEMIENIQKAIDYIEDNISTDLNFTSIASHAYMSDSHFQKVFLAICGVSVGDYIRNRKLTLAGNEVVTTKAKIIDIASKFGYETPEGFSRAFSRFHNTSPTAARRQGELNMFAKISIVSMITGEAIMENEENKNEPICSFCNKSQLERKVLVAGTSTAGKNIVYICEECVSICSDLVETQLNKMKAE